MAVRSLPRSEAGMLHAEEPGERDDWFRVGAALEHAGVRVGQHVVVSRQHRGVHQARLQAAGDAVGGHHVGEDVVAHAVLHDHGAAVAAAAHAGGGAEVVDHPLGGDEDEVGGGDGHLGRCSFRSR